MISNFCLTVEDLVKKYISVNCLILVIVLGDYDIRHCKMADGYIRLDQL